MNGGIEQKTPAGKLREAKEPKAGKHRIKNSAIKKEIQGKKE